MRVARASLHGRPVAVTGRTAGAVEIGATRGRCAARCKDSQHNQRPKRSDQIL